MSTFGPLTSSKPTSSVHSISSSRTRAAVNARAFKEFMSKPDPRLNGPPLPSKPLKTLADPAVLRSKPLSEKSNVDGPRPAVYQLSVPSRPRRPLTNDIATPSRPMISVGGHLPFPLSIGPKSPATVTPSGKALVTPLTTRFAQISAPAINTSPSGMDKPSPRRLLVSTPTPFNDLEDSEMSRGLLQSPKKGEIRNGKGAFMKYEPSLSNV